MLRLFVVAAEWAPESSLAYLLRGLADAGVDVAVSVPGAEHPLEGAGRRPLLHFVAASASSQRAVERLRLAGAALSAAVRAPGDVYRLTLRAGRRAGRRDFVPAVRRLLPLVALQPDVIYVSPDAAGGDHHALFQIGRPVLVGFGATPAAMVDEADLRANLASSAAVLCASAAAANEALRLGLGMEKVHVMRPGVDSDFFRPPEARRMAGGALRIISVGSMKWYEGYEYALSALRRLIDAGVVAQWTIVGDGRERRRVLYTAHDLGLADLVHLAGRRSAEEVRSHMQESDVFVVSNLSEGIPDSVLAAMACGLPVVTSDCGGMREAIDDGLEGLVVPMRDPEAMAQALQRLAADPSLRRQLGWAARARVLRDFTLDREVGEFLRLCREVVK